MEPNTLVCDADPVHSIYINHRGEVSPCVYLGLTVQGRQVPRFYHGEARPFDTISFGYICDGLKPALQSGERKKFIQAFNRRNVSKNPLAMFTYMAGQGEEGELSPPPVPCQHCYKMLGI